MTDAWSLLLGDDLHYGVFNSADEVLLTATRRLTALMVDAAQVAAGLDLLDVGCGTGTAACELGRDHGVRVVGITTSVVGIAAARERAAAHGLEALVSFELRDGMANGFPDASFDRVWALESSHLMRRREQLMSECVRVLRPGGRFVLCDIVLRAALPFEEVRRLREPLTLLRDVFGDARMEPLATYVEMAERLGLVPDHRVDLTDVTRPTFARWRENADRHAEQVVASIGDSGLDAFVRATDVLERFWDDGVLGYGLLAGRRPA